VWPVMLLVVALVGLEHLGFQPSADKHPSRITQIAAMPVAEPDVTRCLAKNIVVSDVPPNDRPHHAVSKRLQLGWADVSSSVHCRHGASNHVPRWNTKGGIRSIVGGVSIYDINIHPPFESIGRGRAGGVDFDPSTNPCGSNFYSSALYTWIG